mgnify:CR=1 FL=1
MIGAVIALDTEAEALLDQMEIENILTVHGKPVYLGKAFGKDVALCVCGVGKVNAAVGTCAVLEKGADIVLNFGVAGGLCDQTELTEVYLIDKAVQYDFDITQLEGGEVGTLDGETENSHPLYVPASLDYPRRALGTGRSVQRLPRRPRPADPAGRAHPRHGGRRHCAGVQVCRRPPCIRQGDLRRLRRGKHHAAV